MAIFWLKSLACCYAFHWGDSSMNTCVYVNAHAHTYKSIPFVLQIEACLQNNNVYKRFSLHIRFPAEPSANRMCEMSDSVAKLIGSNGTICYACGEVPGLTHPSQALSISGVCSPPPSKTSIFGHFYMAHVVHKHWDKQWHRCTHTCSYWQYTRTRSTAQILNIHPCIFSICPKPRKNTNICTTIICTLINMAPQKPNTCHAWGHIFCESIFQMCLCGLVWKLVYCKIMYYLYCRYWGTFYMDLRVL